MSGEIDAVFNETFADGSSERITKARLNALVQSLVQRIAAGAITERELADGSITPEKLSEAVTVNVDVADNSVTDAKIVDGAVLRDKLGLDAYKQVQQVNLTSLVTVAKPDPNAPAVIPGFVVGVTPRRNTDKVLVGVMFCARLAEAPSGTETNSIRLYRKIGSGSVTELQTIFVMNADSTAANWYGYQFLDAPATTLAVEYSLQVHFAGGAPANQELQVNPAGNRSSMTLQDVPLVV